MKEVLHDAMHQLREQRAILAAHLLTLPHDAEGVRELVVAITRLDEALMWAWEAWVRLDNPAARGGGRRE